MRLENDTQNKIGLASLPWCAALPVLNLILPFRVRTQSVCTMRMTSDRILIDAMVANAIYANFNRLPISIHKQTNLFKRKHLSESIMVDWEGFSSNLPNTHSKMQLIHRRIWEQNKRMLYWKRHHSMINYMKLSLKKLQDTVTKIPLLFLG